MLDHVRDAWRRLVGARAPGLDAVAHRAYGELTQRLLALRIAADRRSYRALRRLESGRAPANAVVPVALRPLGGRTVWLRAGSSDALMVRETFRDGVYAPPPELAGRPLRHIVDLGANIGITVAANAERNPGVRILAVELDHDNAELCRRNIAPWADRVDLVEAAVWTDEGEVPYERAAGNEFGFHVVATGGTDVARAVPLETLFRRLPEGARVDFLKMDIEGVERLLLSGPAAGWAARVDAIAAQIHDPYDEEAALRDLRALGFSARADRAADYVVGVRP